MDIQNSLFKTQRKDVKTQVFKFRKTCQVKKIIKFLFLFERVNDLNF